MTKVEKIIFAVLIVALALTAIFWNDVRTLLGGKQSTISEETIKKDKKNNDRKKKDKKDEDDKDKDDKKKTSSGFDLNEDPDIAHIYTYGLPFLSA